MMNRHVTTLKEVVGNLGPVMGTIEAKLGGVHEDPIIMRLRFIMMEDCMGCTSNAVGAPVASLRIHHHASKSQDVVNGERVLNLLVEMHGGGVLHFHASGVCFISPWGMQWVWSALVDSDTAVLIVQLAGKECQGGNVL
eukprot:scaffold56785_cov18-Tisochrysis_lutea.AAC.3